VRIFLAGATGVIGRRLAPLLVAGGHVVAGTTRDETKSAMLRDLGAEPVVVDVFDLPVLTAAVTAFAPDLVLHQLTDLPDDYRRMPEHAAGHARIRAEGTRNLLAAAAAAGSPRIVAQSIAWTMAPGPGADAVADLERLVLAADGVVLRYGQFYGPGTFHPDALPAPPRIAIDDAARRTALLLDAPPGIVVVEDR